MKANTYYGICSLSNLLANHVIVKRCLITKYHRVIEWRTCGCSLCWLRLSVTFWFHNVQVLCRRVLLQHLLLLRECICFWLLLDPKLIGLRMLIGHAWCLELLPRCFNWKTYRLLSVLFIAFCEPQLGPSLLFAVHLLSRASAFLR